MTDDRILPFATHGAEKMIYDARMRPQALATEDGRIAVVWQGAADGLLGHPHLAVYDRDARHRTAPRQVGQAVGLDHHFAPIIWRDAHRRFHILWNCHFSPGSHIVSRGADALDQWQEAPSIAPSITYPSVWHVSGGRRLLLYRVAGHLGYWVVRLSDDGDIWRPEETIIDFDREPRDEADRWAGSYLGVCPSRDGRSLHIGLTWWDERHNAHPRYRFRRDLLTRYNLYYLRLDLDTLRMTALDGAELPRPLNRSAARRCLVLETGDELTNFPTVAAGPDDEPLLLAPVSEGDPWRCRFRFFRPGPEAAAWSAAALPQTDNTWSASRLWFDADGLVADLVVGRGKGEETFYGGGEIQRWKSADGGATWRHLTTLTPQEGLLYNNFQPIEHVKGGELHDSFVCYGWSGPGGVWAVDGYATESRNRGQAFLRLCGRWV